MQFPNLLEHLVSLSTVFMCVVSVPYPQVDFIFFFSLCVFFFVYVYSVSITCVIVLAASGNLSNFYFYFCLKCSMKFGAACSIPLWSSMPSFSELPLLHALLLHDVMCRYSGLTVHQAAFGITRSGNRPVTQSIGMSPHISVRLYPQSDPMWLFSLHCYRK